MNLNSLLFFLMSIGSTFSYSQSDTLNRVDNDGEKMGWWLIYLDDNLKQLKDSSDATHCRYTYYTGKFDHYNMGTIGSKKSPVLFPDSDTLNVNGNKLLNGDYVAYFKNGKVQFILSAEKGVLTEYREYYDSGQLKTHFIYSPLCGAPIRGCIKTYSSSGVLTYEGYNRIPKSN